MAKRPSGNAPSPPAAPPPGPRQHQVLIVDDEPDILRSLAELLESSDPRIHCLTAASGPAAVEILRTTQVDLILTDYRMPGMDGLEFLRHADELAPRVPRMMVTAFADLELAVEAINLAGVEKFLRKPLEPGEVIRAVRDSLARRQAKQDRDRAIGKALGRAGKGAPDG